MFIRWNNDTEGFQLPVNPETYTLDGKQTNTSVFVHDLGEINLKGKRGLYALSWSCFFPSEAYDFCLCPPDDPMRYVQLLTELMENNTTVHVVIGVRVNLFCTIETFTWGEDDGSCDISYSIAFKEYREPGNATRTEKDALKQTYTWKKGDSWKKVCKKLLGSATYAEDNKKRNKKVIEKAKKKHPKKKANVALIGYEVVIQK